MTIILSDPRKTGGVNTWSELYIKSIHDTKIVYSLEELKNHTSAIKQNLVINNYVNSDLYQQDILNNITCFFKLYFVVHSDLCPNNKLFVNNMKYFTGAICICYSAYEKITRLYPSMELIYIPNTIQIVTNPITKSSIKSTIRLHYVGRLTSEKNIPMLLEALIQLDGIVLYIYGDNNNQYGKYLKQLTKYFSIENKVVFMGQVDTKSELYEEADFVILPSVHEGLPYCLLEAKSFNIPIISHNVSKIDHHIPNGMYYQYDGINIDDFVNALYIDDYNYLLKKIGYSEILISATIMKTKKEIYDLLVPLCTKDGRPLFGKKILVPPTIFGTKSIIYSKNIDKIAEIIENAIFHKECFSLIKS